MFLGVALVCLLANTSVEFLNIVDVGDGSTLEVEQPTTSLVFSMMILNEAVSNELRENMSAGSEFVCVDSVPLVSAEHVFEVSSNPFSYAIDVGGLLGFFLFNCSGEISVPSDVSFVLKSRWGYLSGDVMPVLVIVWIEFVWYLVLMILWIVNLVRHKALKVMIHHLILISLILQCLAAAVQGCVYLYVNFSSPSQELLVFNDLVQLVMNFIVLALVLCFACGISIVKDRFMCSEVAMVIVIPIAFAAAQFFITSQTVSRVIPFGLEVAVLIFFCICYIVFIIVYIYKMNQSLQILKEHMLMIKSSGVEPKHTPTHRKIKMLKRLRNYGMFIFFLFAFSTILLQGNVFVFWVLRLAVDTLTCICFTLICWVCRVRTKMSTLYFEDEEAYEVTTPDNGTGQRTPWAPGTKLPPMPKKAHKNDMRVYPEYNPGEVHYTEADREKLEADEPTVNEQTAPSHHSEHDDEMPSIANPRETKQELSDVDIDIQSSST